MLVPNSAIIGQSVKSLSTYEDIARIEHAIVDYDDLTVIAYEISGRLARELDVDTLLTSDIRELANLGAIVDSSDELINANDVLRVAEIKRLRFDLIGLKVETKYGKKLGVVTDFTYDPQTFMVMQFIVKRPLTRSLLDPFLTIPRESVVEVTDYKLILKDDKDKKKSKQSVTSTIPQDFVPNYVNPFRRPAAEPSDK
jgi:sporulation protein YlmC with PRC-barrel domain